MRGFMGVLYTHLLIRCYRYVDKDGQEWGSKLMTL